MTNPTIAIQANRLENLASHVQDAQVRRELRSVAAELRKAGEPVPTRMATPWLTDPTPTPERQFAEWLNERRGRTVAEVFHEIMRQFADRPDVCSATLPFGGCPECGSVKCVARACVLPRGLAAVPTRMAFTPSHMHYVQRYGGNCRDCADERGVCPGSGLPCGGSAKAVQHVFDALTYGVENGYIPLPVSGGAK